MSVSGESARCSRIAARTLAMNAASSARRTAISTYSRPLCATVSVTPRFARVEYEVHDRVASLVLGVVAALRQEHEALGGDSRRRGEPQVERTGTGVDRRE